MTIKDISHGPAWAVWIGFAVLVVLSGILISGHGANLISGYNTLSKETKAKYDEKKLCRVAGVGILFVAVMILILVLFEEVLPAIIAYVMFGVVIVDCIVVIVLANTICKKR